MKVKQVISYLETVAPLHLQEDYDNAGLITGCLESTVTGILICIDSTEAVLDECIRKKCNLIIAHHPIIFEGLKKITGRTYVERVILKAIQNNISIYASHTNLDNVATGVNKKICNKLELKNCKILLPSVKAGSKYIGSGMIGDLAKPMAEMAVLSKIKSVMKAGSLRYTKLRGMIVRKVAVCGGSGSFLLEAAKAAQADIFLTSDFKYHQFFDADNKTVIADIGHYESEQYTKELIRDILKKKISIFAPHLSEVNTNPINYI